MAERSEHCYRIQARHTRSAERREGPALRRDGLSAGDEFEMRCQGVKSKNLAGGFAAGCDAVPPDERSAALEFHAGRLLEARTSERDQLIGQVFQVRAGRDADVHPLRCEAFGRTAPIDPGGASGRDLRLRSGADIHLAVQRIAIEDSAGEIVNMRQRFSGRRAESTNDTPGRLLLLDAQNGRACVIRFKRQVEV